MADQPTNPSDADLADVPDDVQALILRYHDNDLNAAGLSQLREALTQSESARALFVRWAMHSQLLSESLSANYQEEGEDPWQGSPTILAELAKLEQQAQASLVEIHNFDKPWYASRWAAGLGSIAAILALAITLILTLTANDSPPTQPDFTTNTPQNKPAASTQSTPRGSTPGTLPVATLTAQHNATWGRPASAGPEHPPTTGSKLHPNQRLTLTAGFAEITTNRGAIAILEAPATIEFINNNNAVKLHAGKLVGICETESSKGFLVRTAAVDITDLGTRFGVAASQNGETEVHVFAGEVRAARPGTEPVVLAADQSAQASAGSNTITAIDHSPARFAALRSVSGPGPDLRNNNILDTDTSGIQWLIVTSEHDGTATFNGNMVAGSVEKSGFSRGVVSGNAYGFIQHRAEGAGLGKPATATGRWTFSNLPAGRYDVATSFMPSGASLARYTVNGTEVLVDQSKVPAANAGPTFDHGLRLYRSESDVFFTRIGSSIAVDEGGSITVTIDNANVAADHRTLMDSVAITLVPEADQN